ncbi:hypothetical protein QO034_13595 [Sedimentitalea sp. JM2-8]|uniref:Uncharacterized protein n=1 Tax=Sedimentitalea xiamensis TaxID=3050037 RepID=A0ABT7FG99_9RHOB|nr:hypothetical protein [Sedimentitalea xiamensis]MDK3074151.1 hypothetical protein [Sedimentitalea xiamensis]
MSRSLSRSIAFLAGALMLSVPAARADTPVSYTDNGRTLFSFDAPDFWTVHVGGPRDLVDPATDEARAVGRVIGLQPATEPRLWVGFISPYGVNSFSQVQDYLKDIGPFLVEDAVVDRRNARTVAGRTARTISGQGRRNGKAVAFTAVAIDLPNDRMAVSVVVMEAGLDPARVEDVNRMFASLRVGR